MSLPIFPKTRLLLILVWSRDKPIQSSNLMGSLAASQTAIAPATHTHTKRISSFPYFIHRTSISPGGPGSKWVISKLTFSVNSQFSITNASSFFHCLSHTSFSFNSHNPKTISVIIPHSQHCSPPFSLTRDLPFILPCESHTNLLWWVISLFKMLQWVSLVKNNNFPVVFPPWRVCVPYTL